MTDQEACVACRRRVETWRRDLRLMDRTCPHCGSAQAEHGTLTQVLTLILAISAGSGGLAFLLRWLLAP